METGKCVVVMTVFITDRYNIVLMGIGYPLQVFN
nr:MAG TPA: hypothetical protein [Caudoviricetes sp.]